MKKIVKFLAIILIIFVLIYLADSIYNLVLRTIHPIRYEEHINKYSEEYNLDKFWVMAIIKAESNYIHDAHSGVARGLMQITDDTAEWISKKLDIPIYENDMNDPEKNIQFGCFYLSYLMKHYNNDETLVLTAYNAGMGNVSKWLDNPEYSPDGIHLEKIPFKETREYVEKVKNYKNVYEELYK